MYRLACEFEEYVVKEVNSVTGMRRLMMPGSRLRASPFNPLCRLRPEQAHCR
jgi:hypothetical protein